MLHRPDIDLKPHPHVLHYRQNKYNFLGRRFQARYCIVHSDSSLNFDAGLVVSLGKS